MSIKDQYKNNNEALFNLGVAYFEDKEYNKAEDLLRKANALKFSYMTEFLILSAEVYDIIDKRGAFITITDSEKSILKNAYSKFSSSDFQSFFEKGAIELQIEYWQTRISTLLFLEPQKTLDEIQELPIKVRKHPNIEVFRIDALMATQKYEEALTSLQQLYKTLKKPLILNKIFILLLQQEKYDEILKMAENLEEEDFDDEGLLASTIINTLSKLKSVEEINEVGERYLLKVKTPVNILLSLASINCENNNTEMGETYFQKIVNYLKEENYPPRMIFAEKMLEYDFPQLALNCLRPYIPFNDNAKKLYVQTALDNNLTTHYKEINEILNNKTTHDDVDWEKLKIDFLYKTDRKFEALKLLEKLLAINPTPSMAYNAVVLKRELGEKDNYSKLAKILERDDHNPISIITAASCYNIEGNYDFAQNLSYKALALQGPAFDELVIANFLIINFANLRSKKDEIIDLEEVEVDSAVELVNDKKRIWIVIDSEKSLFEEKQELNFIGAQHFHSSDTISADLLNNEIDSMVDFHGNQYKIASIITKKARAIRHSLEEFHKYRPNSTFLRKIELDDDPVQSLIPFLAETERQKQQILEEYNLKSNIGLPIWLLKNYIANREIDTIHYLFRKTQQIFYAGEVSELSNSKTPKVLSSISIYVLALIERLDNIVQSDIPLIITQSTYDHFKYELEQISLTESKVEMTIGFEDDKPFINQIDKESLKKRKSFFKSILKTIDQIQVENPEISDNQLDKHVVYINSVSKHDYESIILSLNKNYIIASDDLFVRKLAKSMNQNLPTCNSITLLYSFFQENIDALIKNLINLAEVGFLYVYSSRLLIELSERIIKEKRIIGTDTLYDKLKKLISCSLSTKALFQFYEPILFETIRLISSRHYGDYSDHILQIIIQEIWKRYSLYNIDEVILLAKLRSLSSTSNEFEKYKDIFESIKYGSMN